MPTRRRYERLSDSFIDASGGELLFQFAELSYAAWHTGCDI
jgi:hypothetical protein